MLKIWFLDDREDNRQAWLNAFPKEIQIKCELRVFRNWEELKMEYEKRNLPEILFLDYFIGKGASGSRVIRWMKRKLNQSEIPIIVAHSSMYRANQKMIKDGANCFLEKSRGEKVSSSVRAHIQKFSDLEFLIENKKFQNTMIEKHTMRNKFWKIINQAKLESEDWEDRPNKLKEILLALGEKEIIEFEKIYQEKMIEAYRWDLWGAAYIISGGCSDDGFHYFCSFLISEGEGIFNNAIIDPNSLSNINIEEDAELEEFGYVASEVYEEKTGETIPDNNLDFPADPIGKNWEEKDLDGMFPKLAAKYS